MDREKQGINSEIAPDFSHSRWTKFSGRTSSPPKSVAQCLSHFVHLHYYLALCDLRCSGD
jgi:hypothetical protein